MSRAARCWKHYRNMRLNDLSRVVSPRCLRKRHAHYFAAYAESIEPHIQYASKLGLA